MKVRIAPAARWAPRVPHPLGVGVLLFGGRRTKVSNNRIHGNYLVGVGALKQILLKQTDAADLIGNQVHDNQFGLGGADLNGRELFYDGTGSDNCFGPNVGVQTTAPADGSTFNQSAQSEAINWSVGDPTHEAFWLRHPHAPKSGLTPLAHCKK